MSNQLQSLLTRWHADKNTYNWVLGVIYKTEGPCYRKAGAMMFFNDIGQQLGLLSGGCLEADLQRHAQRVMQNDQPHLISYDASDEDDISFQLGIGCGGVVHIALLPISRENNYLALEYVLEGLNQRQTGIYQLNLDQAAAKFTAAQKIHTNYAAKTQILKVAIKPAPHLLIVGGGVDAQPIANIAKTLGWQVSLCDPRPANARKEHFPQVDHILRNLDDLNTYASANDINAAVIMAHNIELDAAALKQLYTVDLNYLALLGPTHRRQDVITTAGISEAGFKTPLHGPAGFDIGGELPESIALAILAQCHSALHGKLTD